MDRQPIYLKMTTLKLFLNSAEWYQQNLLFRVYYLKRFLCDSFRDPFRLIMVETVDMPKTTF